MLALCLAFAGFLPASNQPFSEHGLTLSLEALEGFEGGPVDDGQVRARWTGEVSGTEFEVELRLLDRNEFTFSDPAGLVSLIENHFDGLAQRDGGEFQFDRSGPVEGAFGYITYAWRADDTRYEDTRAAGSFSVLAGILKDWAYSVEVTTTPAVDDETRGVLDELLEACLTYDGELADVRWSDEEVEARWQSDAPDKVLEDSELRIVRTDHYVIMTNVGKGTATSFGKKIDECYEQIREVYPFEDVEGQRLLPIFYFVTNDQYYHWYAKNLNTTVERARRSGGVSYSDVYSTYHQATNDPVHIHEATHQIFKARLRLGGGGSWFQEGVAEYMSATGNELGLMKNLAKRENHVPLREFFELRSLLYSAEANRKKGGSEAGDNYMQAAAVIEFVRHGPYEDEFLEFVHAVGAVPRNDVPAIERELGRVLGTDIAGFEEAFVKYWTKRRKPKKK